MLFIYEGLHNSQIRPPRPHHHRTAATLLSSHHQTRYHIEEHNTGTGLHTAACLRVNLAVTNLQLKFTTISLQDTPLPASGLHRNCANPGRRTSQHRRGFNLKLAAINLHSSSYLPVKSGSIATVLLGTKKHDSKMLSN